MVLHPVERDGHVAGAVGLVELPRAGLVAGHLAVLGQRDVHRLVDAAVVGAVLVGDLLRALERGPLVVDHELVVAGHVLRVVLGVGGLGAGVFVRRGDQPAVVGRQQLAHAYLVHLAGVGEAAVVHDVRGAVVVHERRVVALRDFDVRVVVAAPLDRAHETHADLALPVVADGVLADCGVAVFIDVRTGDLVGAEHAHLVAAGLLQVAVGCEQIPVAVGMQQVRAFAGVAEAAAELDAVVGVGLVLDRLVRGAVVAQAGLRIELEHPHAAEP